jgi:hypothetical protein
MQVLVTGAKQSGEYGEVWGYALPPGKGSLKVTTNATLLSVRWRVAGALASVFNHRLATRVSAIFTEKDPEDFYKVETVSADAGLLNKHLRGLQAQAGKSVPASTYRAIEGGPSF